MSKPGFTIFLLFFGVSLLDAVGGGHWARVAFWVAMGVLFWVLDRVRPGTGAQRKPRRETPEIHH